MRNTRKIPAQSRAVPPVLRMHQINSILPQYSALSLIFSEMRCHRFLFSGQAGRLHPSISLLNHGSGYLEVYTRTSHAGIEKIYVDGRGELVAWSTGRVYTTCATYMRENGGSSTRYNYSSTPEFGACPVSTDCIEAMR